MCVVEQNPTPLIRWARDKLQLRSTAKRSIADVEVTN